MSLWISWCEAIWLLPPAFSRRRSFLWFATAVAGLTVRTELLGVTSIVRVLKLDARFYTKLLNGFHSRAVRLDGLSALWTQAVLRLFPDPLPVNGRRVLVGAGEVETITLSKYEMHFPLHISFAGVYDHRRHIPKQECR